jgi:hypothetical protein
MTILFLYLKNKLSLENAGSRPCLDEFRKTKELQGKSELCVWVVKKPWVELTMPWGHVQMFDTGSANEQLYYVQ